MSFQITNLHHDYFLVLTMTRPEIPAMLASFCDLLLHWIYKMYNIL